MACVYSFKGQSNLTYQELLDLISDSDLNGIMDLLFSEGSRADEVYDQLNTLKSEQIEKSKMAKAAVEAEIRTLEDLPRAKIVENMIDGSPLIKGVFTVNDFLKSTMFRINGESPMFQFDNKQYVEYMKAHYIETGKMTIDQANQWGEDILTHWDTLGAASANFHKLMMMGQGTGNDWHSRASEHAPEYVDIYDKLGKAQTAIFEKLAFKGGGKRNDPNHKMHIITNLNLSAEFKPDLKGDYDEVFGHIDYLLVMDNGDVEIFNIKTSEDEYADWPDVKKQNYRYELAMLKKMLASHGINTQHIGVNIIPVQLKFDNTMNTIEDIRVGERVIPMDMYEHQYIFQPYDRVASQFFDAPLTFTSEPVAALNDLPKQLQFLFPGKDVMVQGIQMTAMEWADLNWKNCSPEELPDGGYKLTMPDTNDVVEVTDPRTGARNKQFVKYIEDNINLEEETVSGTVSAHVLMRDLEQARNIGKFSSSASRERGRYLNERFSKYFTDRKKRPDGTYRYTWKIVDSPLLKSANIIAFQNLDTNQLDVFTLTSVDPDAVYEFKKGNSNLLGAYINELNSDRFTMKATYANIEAIRTVAILNEVLPEIAGEAKLGQLQVIGLGKYSVRQGASFEFSDLLSQWGTIVRIVNRETNGNAGLTNKLQAAKIQSINPIEVLDQTISDIVSDAGDVDISTLEMVKESIHGKVGKDGIAVDGLMDAQTVEARIDKLMTLVERLRQRLAERGVNLSNQRTVIDLADHGEKELKALARIYIVAQKALLLYSGETVVDNETLSSLEELAITPTSINNNSARRAGFLVQKAIDLIRNKIIEWYNGGPKQIFAEYYKACGYTAGRNALIGDQASVYKNLYQVDENGTNTFLFKNPYDPNVDLKQHERTFLKKILYEFYKVRIAMNPGSVKEITGPEDKRLYQQLPKNYLYVPLQKASLGTRNADIKGRVQQLGKDLHRIFTDPGGYAEELRGNLTRSYVSERDSAIREMRTYNKYSRSELNQESRNSIINERGVQYFETNVENLFIDFMAQQVQCEENNKLLMKLRGIELALTLKGLSENDSDIKEVEKVVKYIDDYITVNVYNKSIMEPTAQKIDNFIQPFRRLVSEFYIAANPAAFFRDILQGLQENFMMAAIKYQTDVGVDDVAFAYKEVIMEGATNMMNMSKLNQFNVKYGFSNFDAAKVSERLKSGRAGVLNGSNWLYCTLRGPDYLNRMVLFVAKLKHDGAYEAYSLDEEGRLKYDWKKDKRFSAYAAGDTSNPKYNEQRALYMSLIRAFNTENPSRRLSYNDALPDAYTMEQIRSIKTLSESIYGAYDQSARSKFESTAVGRNFLFFTTWMNGMVNTYYKKPQVSHSELALEQETDYDGNKLFFEADGSGNTTTVDTGIPVMKYVPIMVQGVFNTFGQIFKEAYDAYNNGGLSKFSDNWKKNIWNNPINRRNLRRALTDLLVMIILGSLFKYAVTPAYKKHRKEDDGSQFITNALVEMIYKGGKASFDTFKGPVAVIEYLGESTNPATYTLQKKLVTNTFEAFAGKKTAVQVLMDSQAFFRSMQDSYKMYLREQKQNQAAEAAHPEQK